jgi:hypothetical protein
VGLGRSGVVPLANASRDALPSRSARRG